MQVLGHGGYASHALYGTDHHLRQFIESQGLHYVLAVSCDQTIWVGKSQYPC